MQREEYPNFCIDGIQIGTKEPTSLCISNPHNVVSSVIDAFKILVIQKGGQMEKTDTAINSKLARKIEALNQHRSHLAGVEADVFWK